MRVNIWALLAVLSFVGCKSTPKPAAERASVSVPPAPSVAPAVGCQASAYSHPGRKLSTRALLTEIRDELLEQNEPKRKSPDHFIEIGDDIEKTFGLKQQAPASTEATCCHDQIGFAVRVPFNPKWVNDRYALAPCDWEDDALRFGPLRYDWHGHHLYRRAMLQLAPARSLERALDAAQRDEDRVPSSEPQRLELSGRAGVAHTIEPQESERIAVLELVGEKHNVVLRDYDADLEFLKRVAGSLPGQSAPASQGP